MIKAFKRHQKTKGECCKIIGLTNNYAFLRPLDNGKRKPFLGLLSMLKKAPSTNKEKRSLNQLKLLD